MLVTDQPKIRFFVRDAALLHHSAFGYMVSVKGRVYVAVTYSPAQASFRSFYYDNVDELLRWGFFREVADSEAMHAELAWQLQGPARLLGPEHLPEGA